MLDLDAIRARLRARYEAKGLPATGLWHKTYGVGQTTVRNFLDGSTQSLTLDTVQKLEEPLGTTAEWIIFGERAEDHVQVSDNQLRDMVEEALSEIVPGMSLAEIKPAVASSLHAQLERLLAGEVEPDHEGEVIAPGKGAQSPAPTTEGGTVGSRNP